MEDTQEHPVMQIVNNYIRELQKNLSSLGERTGKKRHHYIPRHYLKGFINKSCGMLNFYEKGVDLIRKASPDNVAVENHGYTIEKDKGVIDSVSVEDLFAGVEDRASHVIEKVSTKDDLTDDDRAILAVFASHLFIRVPNFRDMIAKAAEHNIRIMSEMTAATPERFKRTLEQASRENPEPFEEILTSDAKIEEARQFALSERYSIKVRREFTLTSALALAIEFAMIIYDMNWYFLLSNDSWNFVTSDNPFARYDTASPEYGIGFASKTIELTLPLNSEICMFCSWKKPYPTKYVTIKNSIIKEINKRTVQAAVRFVYANVNSRGLLNLTNKNIGTAPYVDLKSITTSDGSRLSVLRHMSGGTPGNSIIE